MSPVWSLCAASRRGQAVPIFDPVFPGRQDGCGSFASPSKLNWFSSHRDPLARNLQAHLMNFPRSAVETGQPVGKAAYMDWQGEDPRI